MSFPKWVPAAVRTKITAMIDGDAWEPHGWGASLDSAERRLAEIELDIKKHNRPGQTEHSDDLNKERADAVKHRALIAADVDCLRRLGSDMRMRDVFSLLANEFKDEREWRAFIQAAWAARMDYAPIRARLELATELRDKIAKTATKLAKLLRDTASVGLDNWPSEFFSIPELLRQTDSHEERDRNLDRWRGMRGYILGDQTKFDILTSEQAQKKGDSDCKSQIEIPCAEKFEIDVNLRNGWAASPRLSALLNTVASAAQNFEPSEDGMIGSAINSRKKTARTAYIRAFGHVLAKEYKIALTPAVKSAMAIVTDVAMNEGLEKLTADIQGLRHFLENTVIPWFGKREGELVNRPLIRQQAFGEALDPDKLEKLSRYEVFLDRKLDRMVSLLLRLQNLRGANDG